jgi:TIR domain
MAPVSARSGQVRAGVFVSYRRDDTGPAAAALAAALRLRMGADRVFLDSSSIELGKAFPDVIEAAVTSSAVLAVLIGPGWDESPLRERLDDEQDWVRREVLLAEDHRVAVVPVLVDRDALPGADRLPAPLRFLRERHVARLRPAEPGGVEALADALAALDGQPARTVPAAATAQADGAEPTREALDRLARHLLPPAQQWSGNRDRLVDLALAVLTPSERLVFLAPARLPERPRGSAAALLTASDLVLVDVGEDFHIRGETRLPLAWFGRIEITPTFPLFADLIAHTTGGARVPILGLFKDQARQLADHIRVGATRHAADPAD